MNHDTGAGRLGAGIVQRLIPHRRPMLMIDAITAVRTSPTLSVRSERLVSAGEALFDGHFPGLEIWPGCMLIEGLAQACNLHVSLAAMLQQYEARGSTADDALRDLRALDDRVWLHAPQQALHERLARMEEILVRTRAHGLLAAVDVRLSAPVMPGDVVEYVVDPERVVGRAVRFEVAAGVRGRPVARGRLSFVTQEQRLPR